MIVMAGLDPAIHVFAFLHVIASQRVGAGHRPTTGSAKQSSRLSDKKNWIASPLRSSQ
jgi:hypothetical protein